MSPTPNTLKQAITSILEGSTPNTQDRVVLNELSLAQVNHMTWQVGVPANETSLANLLAPPQVYERSRNKVWRYPPYIGCQYSMSGQDPVLTVRVRFAAPRYVHYSEPDREGNPRSYLARPKKLRPDPSFGKFKLTMDGTNRDYDLWSETGQKFMRHSAPLEMEEQVITIRLADLGAEPKRYPVTTPEVMTVLRRCNVQGDVEEVLTESGEILPEALPLVKTGALGMVILHKHAVQAELRASIKRVETQKDLEWRLNLELHNVQDYKYDRVEDWHWRPMMMLLPHLVIDHHPGCQVLIQSQQHAEIFAERIQAEQHGAPGRSVEDWLEEYQHTNSILTRSTDLATPDRLILSTFAAYDTIRVQPVMSGGLRWTDLADGPMALLAQMDQLSAAARSALQSNPARLQQVFRVLRAVMRGFGKPGEPVAQLRLYQWHAIQKRIDQVVRGLADPEARKDVRVVRAPTAAGKTLVFMANAAIHVALTDERAVMVFPTRVLNEDMFKRLTKLVCELRQEFNQPQDTDFRGGLVIGQADPLFRALTKPALGKPMVQYGSCPACGTGQVLARPVALRTVGECADCGHQVDYMYDPNESTSYLPNLMIATPDKLFHMATVNRYDHLGQRFFGAPVVPCTCGQYLPITASTRETVECKAPEASPVRGCGAKHSTVSPTSKPIGYFVFDEVHSLYGLTATLLSTFLDLISRMAWILSGQQIIPVYETGTATIANEKELLTAITRRTEAQIDAFPGDGQYTTYFEPKPERVRYRTLVMLPVAKSALNATGEILDHIYHQLLPNSELAQRLEAIGPEVLKSYAFLLGYVFRKKDIYNLLHTLRENHGNRYRDAGPMQGVEWLSGDATPSRVATVMQAALDQKLRLLLANLVVSMGIDIEGLNHMVSFGFPGSMTEFVQTAGRTGRADAAGHVTILLNPSRPRDLYLYNHLYQMMGDLAGYYERKPAEGAGIYAAQLMLPNVVRGLLGAIFLKNKQWLRSKLGAAFLADKTQGAWLFKTALMVLGGLEATGGSAVGLRIKRGLDADLKRWYPQWTSHEGFLSEWFDQKELLLVSLRERAAKSAELIMVDADLYQQLKDAYATPDSFGDQDENDDVGAGSDEPKEE